ncbi:MAG: gliding motility-associated C-terminal domain-containing protein [Saprospiraceae bacterium]|nr:gliding motility-associated C-terminal domain-containing protein [Saprospiraceae bacterium]
MKISSYYLLLILNIIPFLTLSQTSFVKESNEVVFISKIEKNINFGWVTVQLLPVDEGKIVRLNNFNTCGTEISNKQILLDNIEDIADAKADELGNIYILLRAKNNQKTYTVLLQLNHNFELQWCKKIEKDNFFQPNQIRISNSNAVYLLASTGINKIFLKFDISGQFVWAKSNPNSLSTDNLEIAPDGSFIVSNFASIYKLDAQGNILKSNIFLGEIIGILINSFQIDESGFTGLMNIGDSTHILAKFDYNLEPIWYSKSFFLKPMSTIDLINDLITKEIFKYDDGRYALNAQTYDDNGQKHSMQIVFDSLGQYLTSFSIEYEGVEMPIQDFITSAYDNSKIFVCKNPNSNRTMLIRNNDSVGCTDIIEHKIPLENTPPITLIPSLNPINLENITCTVSDLQSTVVNTGEFYADLCYVSYIEEPNQDTILQICEGDTILLEASQYPFTSSYLWNNGDTLNNAHITQKGEYEVNVKGCKDYVLKYEVVEGECLCDMQLPTAFTPDGDGVNDYFFPVYDCYVTSFTMNIFNRWGEKIFSTNDVNEKWDGRKNGKELPSDAYVCSLSYSGFSMNKPFTKTIAHSVILIR